MLGKAFLNAPLATKVSTAPVLLLAGAIAMGIVAYTGLAGIDERLSGIARTVMPASEQATTLNEGLDAAHTRVFRALSWATAGVSDAQIAKLGEGLLKDLDNLGQIPARLGQFGGSVADPQAVAAIDAALKKYRKSVADTLDLVSDPTVAVTQVMQTDRIYEETKKLVDSVDSRIDQQSRELVGGASQDAGWTLKVFLAVLAVFVLIAAVIVPISALAIGRPVRRLTGLMKTLAAGDASVEIGDRDRRDEIGEMAAAVQVFKEGIIEAARAQEEERRRQQAEIERGRGIEAVCAEFDASSSAAVARVAAAAEDLRSAATGMTEAAEQTSRQSTAVAAASEQASANVQTVATAAEELASSIAEIGRQVAQASTVAAGAVAQAAQTNENIQALAGQARKIGDVLSLITDIAEQTNLLALNATIEAARAGDAGKGFAVVAAEVKNLANQTARATEEISAQIAGIQTATGTAVTAIAEIGRTIQDVDSIAASIASAVEEQAAATQEIARNVEQASRGTHQVTSNIAGVARAAEVADEAAERIRTSSDGLSREADGLRGAVDNFLGKIRSA